MFQTLTPGVAGSATGSIGRPPAPAAGSVIG
jgi:hypothetical protein